MFYQKRAVKYPNNANSNASIPYCENICNHGRRWKNFTNNLLTPWCRILFEKLIATQLVKKYPAFLWNPKVHYRVQTSPAMDPILRQNNPVNNNTPHFLKSQVISVLVIRPDVFENLNIVTRLHEQDGSSV